MSTQKAGNGTEANTPQAPVRHLDTKYLPSTDEADGPTPQRDLSELRATIDERLLNIQKAFEADWRRSLHLLIIFGQEITSKWRELPEPRETSNEDELDEQLAAAVDLVIALRTQRRYVPPEEHPLIDKGIAAEMQKARITHKRRRALIHFGDLMDPALMKDGQ